MSDLAQKIIAECKATKAKTLDLGNCGLTEIPEEVFDCVWLEELNLNRRTNNERFSLVKLLGLKDDNENTINFIPQKINKLNNLKKLILNGNYYSTKKIRNIESLCDLINLQVLFLNDNEIQDLQVLAQLKNLQILSLSNNQIQNITPLTQLRSLWKLYLEINKIQDLQALAQLKNLQILSLSNNEIQNITPLTQLVELLELYLENNKIRNIGSLYQLKNLKVLSIDNNKIQSIESLNSLNNLQILSLSNNQIKNINPINNLSRLRELALSNNPIYEDIPKEMRGAINAQAILQWANEYYQKNVKRIALNQAKILLLGNTNAGKSFLLHYLENTAVPESSDTTKGLQYRSVEKFGLKLNVYDFGGQEYFHGTHQLFFGEDALHLVLWSLKNELREGQNDRCFELAYWLRCIEQLSKGKQTPKSIETILIENKIDREQENGEISFEPTLLDFEQLEKQFTELNLNHTAVSITHQKRLAGLMELIEERLQTLPASKANWTQTYQNVIDAINAQKGRGERVLKLDEIEVAGMSNSEVQIMIPVFHNLGILLFYPKVASVKDLVFIDPQAFLDVLYKEILNDAVREKGGILSKKDFEIANELNLTAKQILDLLQYFHVVFQVKQGSNEYFAPQYLPDKSHSLLDFFIQYNFKKATLRLESDSYLLNLVMLQIFTEYGKAVKGKESSDYRDYLFWRDGIVVEQNNQLLYIQYNREKQFIDFYADKNFGNFELQKGIIDWVLREIEIENNPMMFLGRKEKDLGFKYDDKLGEEAEFNHDISWSDNKYLRISASIDGENFAAWKDIQETKVARFTSKGNEFNLADFKPYIKNKNQMKKIFISYSKQDEKMVNEFIKHLATLTHNNLVETWYCTELKAGEEWEETIQAKLNEADIVCFMISPNFMQTPYIHKYEVRNALKRYYQDKTKVKIVPIILEFCNWQTIYEIEDETGKKNQRKLSDFTALPFTAKPISDFGNSNKAWYTVENALQAIIKENLDSKIDTADLVRKMPIDIQKIYEEITK